MPRPMDLGRAVLFAGSALLLISLFTEWFHAGPVGITGWQVFESLDLVLAALAVGGMLASVRPDLLPPWSGWALPGAAIFIVAVQLIDAPPAAGDATPSGGAWVALAGSLLMAGGAALSLSAISVTVSVRERDLRRREAALDRREETLEAEQAEDLDADPPPSSGGGLFGSGLLGGSAGDDASAPPRRTGRFTPTAGREAPAPAASREGADLERTQPLAGLPDDEDDAERS